MEGENRSFPAPPVEPQRQQRPHVVTGELVTTADSDSLFADKRAALCKAKAAPHPSTILPPKKNQKNQQHTIQWSLQHPPSAFYPGTYGLMVVDCLL